MHAHRRWVALAPVVLLASTVAAGTGQAAEETHCTFAFEAVLTPGLSMEPSSGTHSSEGPTGTITCDGPVNGQEGTGPGTLGDEGRYGTEDPDDCLAGGEGDGVDTIVIPTAGGQETVKSNFTFTYGEVSTKGGVVSGSFEGDRFSGTFEFTPAEGDCINSPMTRASVIGEGTIHN